MTNIKNISGKGSKKIAIANRPLKNSLMVSINGMLQHQKSYKVVKNHNAHFEDVIYIFKKHRAKTSVIDFEKEQKSYSVYLSDLKKVNDVSINGVSLQGGGYKKIKNILVVVDYIFRSGDSIQIDYETKQSNGYAIAFNDAPNGEDSLKATYKY